MNKALFLDRDGTINVDTGYVYRQEDFHFIDGIFDLCRLAQQKGYLIIVITNQSGICRGYYSTEDFHRLSDYMVAEFQKEGISITDIFFCPDLEGEDRKPEAGMFIKAQQKHDIDMAQSLSLGDKERDILAAERAGVGKNILFNDSYQPILELL